MLQQIEVMLRLQDDMNRRIHAQWRQQGNAWYRAIWVESAEMLDHYGWKWWKKQSPDREQVRLELVDIWHFGLSYLLEREVAATVIDSELQNALTMSPSTDFRDDLERFAGATLASKGFDIPGFALLMQGVDLSPDELFHRYVGKNVLNFFRQDHGYLDGTYNKVWQGREDNEHLVEITGQLDAGSGDFVDRLYGELQRRYSQTG